MTVQAIAIDRVQSIRGILGSSLRIYRRYPLLFVVLAVVVIAPYDLLVLALTGAGPLASHAHGNLGVKLVLNLLSFSLAGPLISALHVHAVVLTGEGVRPKLGMVAARGLRVLPGVAAADIMANIGISVGILAFVIPGLILWLRWFVVAQVAAVEHRGWMPAMRRSRELTAHNYRHILGLLVLSTVAVLAVRMLAETIPLGSTSSAGSVALGIAINTAAASFLALTFAFLYFDLRARAAVPRHESVRAYQYPRDLD